MVSFVEYLCDLIITMVYIESVSTGFYDMAQMDEVANIRLIVLKTDISWMSEYWILRLEDYLFISNNLFVNSY